MTKSLIPDPEQIRRVTRENETGQPAGSIVATDDEQLIREWARRQGAEPATGEKTASGPATVDVQDGGAGIRFNFPGMGPFRPISWEEWFANFRSNELLFVYEREDPSGRYRMVPKARLHPDEG